MPTLTHTFTRVFNATVPANPYLRCSACGARVEYWLDGLKPVRNYPCEHAADYEDACPSWGPVDGCKCEAHLGSIPHPPAPAPLTDHGKEQGPL